MEDCYSYVLPGEALVKGDEFFNGVVWLPVTEFFIVPETAMMHYRRKHGAKTEPSCNGDICSKEMCPCADKLDWTEKDEKSLNPPKPDRLATMWQMQKELNKLVGVDSDYILSNIRTDPKGEYEKGYDFVNRKKQIEFSLQFSRCLSQENAEFVDSFPWKHWKKQEVNIQNARVEVVDMFHFLMSMAQVLGMSEEDFFQAYLKKNSVNHKRQDGDYASNPNAVGGETDCKHI